MVCEYLINLIGSIGTVRKAFITPGAFLPLLNRRYSETDRYMLEDCPVHEVSEVHHAVRRTILICLGESDTTLALPRRGGDIRIYMGTRSCKIATRHPFHRASRLRDVPLKILKNTYYSDFGPHVNSSHKHAKI